MLSNFTWLQYGIFIGISLLVYYSVILILYYREEMNSLFAGKLTLFPRLKGTEQKKNLAGDFSDLAGKAAPEPGMSSVSLDELDFGDDGLMQGELADAMQEVNEVIYRVLEEDLDKEGLLVLLLPIPYRYPKLLQSKLLDAFFRNTEQACAEQLPFFLKVGEFAELFRQTERKNRGSKDRLAAGGAAVLAFLVQVAYGQDGNQGIQEASNKVKGYFDSGTDLIYAIGAVVGLIGAVKVYGKWNSGEPDTSKVATAWFGSCIFLVVVASVLKSFFGI